MNCNLDAFQTRVPKHIEDRHDRNKRASRRKNLALLPDILGIGMWSLTMCYRGTAADFGRDLQSSPGNLGVHGPKIRAGRTSVSGGFAREDSQTSSIRSLELFQTILNELDG